MSDRRERFLEQVKKRNSRISRSADDYQLRQMTQGQAPMEALTTSPEWEIFRNVIQGEIERLEKALAELAPTFLNPETTTFEQMLGLKFNALIAGARVDALREVLGMPQVIIEDGEKARDILAERFREKSSPSHS